MLLVSFNVLQLPLYKELRQRGFGTFPAVVASVSAASAATYPLQVIRTRFQAERAVDGRREYQSFGAVVKHVIRQARACSLAHAVLQCVVFVNALV
jgi:ABC-type molybdate transport system substrate-binding protein